MTEQQKIVFNRSLYNVREAILRPRTIDAALISMGMNITGPIMRITEDYPNMEESIKWNNYVYPVLKRAAEAIMRTKASVENDEVAWKAELEKFIVPIEDYASWYKERNP